MNEQIIIAKPSYDLAKANEEGLAAFSITTSMLDDLQEQVNGGRLIKPQQDG